MTERPGRFDGLWARVQEAGVVVGVHGCVLAYGDTYSPPGVFTPLNALTPMQRLFEVDRQVMDTLGSLEPAMYPQQKT